MNYFGPTFQRSPIVNKSEALTTILDVRSVAGQNFWRRPPKKYHIQVFQWFVKENQMLKNRFVSTRVITYFHK